MASISAAIGGARAVFRRPDTTQFGGSAPGNSAYAIGQLISALNDRNPVAAMDLLQPAKSGSGRPKCVGCGE
jgi:hypothetical protein